MKYTNKFGLDAGIAKAISDDPYTLVGDISVTGLLRPPQIAGLEAQHAFELSEDVGDGLWRLLGRAVHSIIAAGRVSGAVQEHRLITRVFDWDVSGAFDIWYDDSYILKDYKVSTIAAYQYGKVEWEQQLNLYALLAEDNGLRVDEARVALIMRDWKVGESKRRKDYPPRPFMEIPVRLWTPTEQRDFLRERVRMHQDARAGDWQPCTDAERWARGEKWAVQKPGAKRAWRVAYTLGMAQQFVSEAKPGYVIEHRPAEQIRCESYCPVRQFCKQADALGVPK